MQLFHAHKCDVWSGLFLQALDQVVVDFARAQHHSIHGLSRRSSGHARVVDDLLEPSFGHGGKTGHSFGVTQQFFGREDHQRLAESELDLSAQEVEIVRGLRDVADEEVVSAAELQEPLHAARAVLRTHAFVAVRQQEGEAVHGPPLVFSCAQKLVKQDLRPVVEIAELRLPNGQAIGRCKGISVVESRHRVLTQKRVENGQLGLFLIQQVQWNHFLFAVLCFHHRVAVRERPALNILTADSHGMAFHQQRGVSQQFTQCPIQSVLLDHLQPIPHEALDLAVKLFAFGQGRHGHSQRLELLLGYGGFGRARQGRLVSRTV